MISVVDYDPTWPAQYAALRSRYAAVLVGVAVAGVEHVGSTSVPGLAAKPIIDVDIVVAGEHVGAAIAAMEDIGFVSLGERGIEDRWALQAPADFTATNTYVVVDGSLSLRNHVGVRDELRRDAALSREYAALKRRLAATVDGIDAYVEGKSAFLSAVLERAGLTEAERGLVADANRAR